MTHPILLIAFNRPEHTRYTLKALLAQNPTEIYVFRDGPRQGNTLDIIKCEKVKEEIADVIVNCQNLLDKLCQLKSFNRC